MASQRPSSNTDNAHVNEEVLKQVPQAWTRVDLLDFDLRVDVTVTEEVDVNRLHLTLADTISTKCDKHNALLPLAYSLNYVFLCNYSI